MRTRTILLLLLMIAALTACVAPIPEEPTESVRPALPRQAQPLPAAPSDSDGAVADAPIQSTLTTAQAQVLAGLIDQGPAPELLNETWINSDPLRLADLRGKVVIVEFWTYG